MNDANPAARLPIGSGRGLKRFGELTEMPTSEPFAKIGLIPNEDKLTFEFWKSL